MVKPILRGILFLVQASEPAGKEDLYIVQDLKDTLAVHRDGCVGMAANMIGYRKNIIIISAGFMDLIMINPVLLTRYDISPDVVDMITFCTKNPSPMLDKMDILSPYGQYWFVTITPYSKEIEPGVPGWEAVTDRSIRQIRSYGRTISCVLTGEIIYNDNYTIPNRTDWFI